MLINNLQDKFPKIELNNCLEIIRDREFEIYDCDENDERCTTGRSYIREVGQFKVINNFEKGIGFLAVDKCLFFDKDGFKKCDCIIFDDDIICFVEIKDCKQGQRAKRKKTAKEQLKSTIQIFQDAVDLDKDTEAYLCVGLSSTRPSILSSSMDSKFEFEEKFNAILFDGCQKSFSSNMEGTK